MVAAMDSLLSWKQVTRIKVKEIDPIENFSSQHKKNALKRYC